MVGDHLRKTPTKEGDVVMRDLSENDTEVINFIDPKRKKVDGPNNVTNRPNSNPQSEQANIPKHEHKAGSARQARLTQ